MDEGRMNRSMNPYHGMRLKSVEIRIVHRSDDSCIREDEIGGCLWALVLAA